VPSRRHPLGPRFPPDVAAALQQRSGSVSVRYTVGRVLARRPPHGVQLMGTYEGVHTALIVDQRGRLCFSRARDPDGQRIARTDVSALLEAGRHWDIALRWSPDEISVEVSTRSAS
jgi:hypothetical protein